jgi:hypothetical protein
MSLPFPRLSLLLKGPEDACHLQSQHFICRRMHEGPERIPVLEIRILPPASLARPQQQNRRSRLSVQSARIKTCGPFLEQDQKVGLHPVHFFRHSRSSAYTADRAAGN